MIVLLSQGKMRRMTTINIADIQRDPIGYLRRVERDEALLVLRDDHPVAEIKPVPAPPDGPRPFGLCHGECTVPDDFDAPLPEHVIHHWS